MEVLQTWGKNLVELQIQKAKLRKELIEKREKLSKEEFEKENVKKVENLKILFEKYLENFKGEEINICAYHPLKKEVDLSSFYEEIFEGRYGEVNLYLPRILDKNMYFYRISSFDDLEKGCFGLMEPKISCVKAEKIENSFVIVPCVGISKDFTRIGYGAGYYDRYFSDSMDNYFVGSTHDFAMNLDFKGESHDIIMNEVI